jgi:hypothetical protein
MRYADMDIHLIWHDMQLEFIKDYTFSAGFECHLFRYTETVE